MLRFVQALIAFRRRQPNVRRGAFLTGKAAKPGNCPTSAGTAPTASRSTGTATARASRACSAPAASTTRPPARDDHAPRRRRAAAVSSCRRPSRALTGGCSSTPPPSRPDDIYPEADGPPPRQGTDHARCRTRCGATWRNERSEVGGQRSGGQSADRCAGLRLLHDGAKRTTLDSAILSIVRSIP